MLEIPLPKNFPFIPKQKYFLVLSLILSIAGLYVMVINGLNYGIDFVGGIKLTYKFNQTVGDGELQSALAGLPTEVAVQRMGLPQDNLFVVKVKGTDTDPNAFSRQVTQTLEAKYPGAVTLAGEESVGPKVGKELRRKGLLAILATLAAMLVYVWIRFDFFFAPGAIVALIHDVIMVMAFLAFFHKEFNLTILAALLTIVGYSMNDTIIVYDRIREHIKSITPTTINDVVNRSINETLSRAIITHLTVLFVVVVLFLSGVGSLHDFAFCFIVGVITATYSSIFVASPIYIFLYKNWPKWFAQTAHARK
jgi:preprotein translocase subunit SecF